jgi:hypothetical protein
MATPLLIFCAGRRSCSAPPNLWPFVSAGQRETLWGNIATKEMRQHKSAAAQRQEPFPRCHLEFMQQVWHEFAARKQ